MNFFPNLGLESFFKNVRTSLLNFEFLMFIVCPE